MIEGIGLERGRVGGSGAWELLREELEVNWKPKKLAFSIGEQAMELSEWIRIGKVELQKVFESFFG